MVDLAEIEAELEELRSYEEQLTQLHDVAREPDIPTWAKRKIGIEPWSGQAKIMRAVPKHKRVAVRSCHQIGKSLSAAVIVAWWIDYYQNHDPFVVTTAPTGAQVKAILWREINGIHRRGDLPGRTNLSEWYLENDRLVAFGRKPSDYDPSAFQGIHSRHLLVVLDEACGIPQSIWDAAESLATNDGSCILAIGNPDVPNTPFEQCFKSDLWTTFHISAFDSPNFTDEQVNDTVHQVLIGPDWVEERKAEWGEDSGIYQSKVLGEFPTNDESSCVPYSWAAQCQTVQLPAEGVVQIGVDVGAGGDRTAIIDRQGMKLGSVKTTRHADAMQCVGEIVQRIQETGATRVAVDVIGVGFGVAGRLEELYREGVHGARVIKVNVANAASDKKRYANLRAEMWHEIGRELSRQKAWDLSNAPTELIAELSTPKAAVDSAGRTKIESKDDIRKRLRASPDLADALLLAFYDDRHETIPAANQVASYHLPGQRNRQLPSGKR